MKKILIVCLIMLCSATSLCAQIPNGIYVAASNENQYYHRCVIIGDSILFLHNSDECLSRKFGYIGKYTHNNDTIIVSHNCLYDYNAVLIEELSNSDSIFFTYTLPHELIFGHRMCLTQGNDTLHLIRIDSKTEDDFLKPRQFYINSKSVHNIDSWLNTSVILHTYSVLASSQISTTIQRGKNYTVKFLYADDFVSKTLTINSIEYSEVDESLTIYFDAEYEDMVVTLWKDDNAIESSTVEDFIKRNTDWDIRTDSNK